MLSHVINWASYYVGSTLYSVCGCWAQPCRLSFSQPFTFSDVLLDMAKWKHRGWMECVRQGEEASFTVPVGMISTAARSRLSLYFLQILFIRLAESPQKTQQQFAGWEGLLIGPSVSSAELYLKRMNTIPVGFFPQNSRFLLYSNL